jgi:DNA polymerase I-like protein with 3'-5' exonuclease and polymerase domains
VQLWAAQQRGELPATSTSTVHDEIHVDCDAVDTPHVAREVQRIMENFRGVFGPIPVIADLEVSTTNWADKKEWNG